MGKTRIILICALVACPSAMADLADNLSPCTPALLSTNHRTATPRTSTACPLDASPPLRILTLTLHGLDALDLSSTDGDHVLARARTLAAQTFQDTPLIGLVPHELLAAVAEHGTTSTAVTDIGGPGLSVDREQIRTLPPPPSGGALTLSGLLTLAGAHLVRSARSAGLAALLNAAQVPDWYHAEAVQIGHSVPFDFQPIPQPVDGVLGLITAESARVALHPRCPRQSTEAEHRIASAQRTLMVTGPRSPPAA